MNYSNPAALKLDSVDDDLLTEICPSFEGGMVSNSRANLLKDNQASLLVNCDVTLSGELVTRRGLSSLGAPPSTINPGGIAYYETPTNNYPVIVSNRKLYSFDGTNWSNTAFGATFTASVATTRVGLVQGIDKLYIAEYGQSGLFSWDGTTVVDLSNVGGTSNTNPPDDTTWMCWHTNRLVMVGGPTARDTIYFSQFLDGAVWDNAKWSLRVGAGEGDAITGIYPWSDFNLIVFKRHSIWIVNCNPQYQLSDPNNTIAGFPIACIHRRIGCMAPATACQVGPDVHFLSDSGVRSIQRVIASETQTQAGDEAVSYPIADYILRINHAAINTCCAFFFGGKYFLSVPLDSETSPTTVFVWDDLRQAWFGYWTNWFATGFAVRNVTNDRARLMFIGASGVVNEWMDYVTLANETDAAFLDAPVTILTKAFNFGEPILRKEGFNAEFEFNGSRATVAASIKIDNGNLQAYETFDTASGHLNIPFHIPFHLPRVGVQRSSRDLQRFPLFREIQFYIQGPDAHSGGTNLKFVLRSIMANAFLSPLEIQKN